MIRVTDKHVFFWSGWPSNWHPSIFTAEYEGKEYELRHLVTKKLLRESSTKAKTPRLQRHWVERLKTITIKFGMKSVTK